jgi:hypothetical protein
MITYPIMPNFKFKLIPYVNSFFLSYSCNVINMFNQIVLYILNILIKYLMSQNFDNSQIICKIPSQF